MVNLRQTTSTDYADFQSNHSQDDGSEDSDDSATSRNLRSYLDNHCGDPRCCRDDCLVRPTVPIYLYYKVHIKSRLFRLLV
jgi:hypothetical protein